MKCCAFSNSILAEKAVLLLSRDAQKIELDYNITTLPSFTKVVVEENGIYSILARRVAESILFSSDINSIDDKVSLYLKETTLSNKEDPRNK